MTQEPAPVARIELLPRALFTVLFDVARLGWSDLSEDRFHPYLIHGCHSQSVPCRWLSLYSLCVFQPFILQQQQHWHSWGAFKSFPALFSNLAFFQTRTALMETMKTTLHSIYPPPPSVLFTPYFPGGGWGRSVEETPVKISVTPHNASGCCQNH